jgi:hypothetical protein
MNPSEEVMRQRCYSLVIAIVGRLMAPSWWHSPNKVFDEHTPEDVLSVNPGMVYEYLMKYSEGEW